MVMHNTRWPSFLNRTTTLLLAFLILCSLLTLAIFSQVKHTLARAQQTPPTSCPSSPNSATYHVMGCFIGRGQQGAKLVGSGPNASTQNYYIVHLYEQSNTQGDFVVVNPTTGASTAYALPTNQQGSYAMIEGPDDNIYIGTLPNAHLLQFNPTTGVLHDFGHLPALPGQSALAYINGFTISPVDNDIYACTYPDADLLRITPSSTLSQVTWANLGTFSPTGTESFAQSCVADPTSPYIYAGLGSVDAEISTYNIATKTFNVLSSITTNPGDAAFGYVYRGTDGNDYGKLAKNINGNVADYQLKQGSASSVQTVPPATPNNVLTQGSYAGDSVEVDGKSADNPGTCDDSVCIVDANQKIVLKNSYSYAGEYLNVFRFALSQDGTTLYGGSIKPFYLISCPIAGCMTSPSGATNLGYVGAGEPYAFLLQSNSNRFYIANYYLPDFMLFDPTQPVIPPPATKTNCTTTTNPLCYNGLPEDDLRPEAMITGPDGKIYIGSSALYGSTGTNNGYMGPLIIWSPTTQTFTDYSGINGDPAPLYSNESIVSLASASVCTAFSISSGTCVVGGTSTVPADNAHGTPSPDAHLFVWDPTAAKIAASTTIPSPPRQNIHFTRLTDLIVNPANNYLLYGIAEAINNGVTTSYLFVYDLKTGTFDGSTTLLANVTNPVFNSIVALAGPDGHNYLWGLAANGVFYINTHNFAQGMAACNVSSQPFTTGFAATGVTLESGTPTGPQPNGVLYFGANGVLWRYTIPANLSGSLC